VYLDLGNYESALEAFDEGIESAKQSRFVATLCVLYLAKSQVLVAMDDLCYASEFADKALEISNSTDDKLTSADSYRVKGIIERRRKNYSDAETFLLISLRMNKSLKNEKNIAETSFELGLLNADMGNESKKTDWLQKTLAYYSEIDATEKVKLIKKLLNTSMN
jgi:tetratricopeptide (TPR) repeat protein